MTLLHTHDPAARTRLLEEHCEPYSLVVAFGQTQHLRNGDVHVPFRQHSDVLYLTGYNSPDLLVAMHCSGPGEPWSTHLFLPEPSPSMARWESPQPTWEAVQHHAQAKAVHPHAAWDTMLADWLHNVDHVYVLDDQQAMWKTTHAKVQRKHPSLTQRPTRSLSMPLHASRRVKRPQEVDGLRNAAACSANAHLAAMRARTTHPTEHGLEGVMYAAIRAAGGDGFAYPPIVAGGIHACTLHHHTRVAPIDPNALVLIDVGAECGGYAGDITRTWPIRGRFNQAQRAVYNVVRTAHQRLIDAVRPGTTWRQLQTLMAESLTEGLLELGILTGSFEDAMRDHAYRHACPHGFGHWLGLDVHDVGGYDQGNVVLEPGMVLTVEPGLYLDPQFLDLAPAWHGLGVRIEDDVLVTPSGREVLSSACPVDLEAIEAYLHAPPEANL